jgi:hypothetical protein
MPSIKSLDGIIRRAVIPSGTKLSGAVNIPRNVGVVTIYMPHALTTDTTFALTSLVPNAEDVTDVWGPLLSIPGAAATPMTPQVWNAIVFTVDGVLTVPGLIFGSGMIRVEQATSQGADRVYTFLFSQFQN